MKTKIKKKERHIAPLDTSAWAFDGLLCIFYKYQNLMCWPKLIYLPSMALTIANSVDSDKWSRYLTSNQSLC